MKLSLGFSPCPNDTFIFDALIHHKIDTEGLEFEVVFEDVENLNKMADEQTLDITKLSYHAFAYVAKNYQILDAGSALGFGVGPLLISHDKQIALEIQNFSLNTQYDYKVGIPGEKTTANFLLGLCYPFLTKKKNLLFSDIEYELLNNEIDLGLIIHENRFTYQDKGLHLVKDLGEFWEESTGHPIPLGGIAVRKTLSNEIKQKINRVIRRSVDYAFAHPTSSMDFVKQQAQAMEESVMLQHIDLYVNEYSLDLGNVGKKAIHFMFEKALELNLIPTLNVDEIFLNPIESFDN